MDPTTPDPEHTLRTKLQVFTEGLSVEELSLLNAVFQTALAEPDGVEGFEMNIDAAMREAQRAADLMTLLSNQLQLLHQMNLQAVRNAPG